MPRRLGKRRHARQGPAGKLTGRASTDKIASVRIALFPALFLALAGCDQLGGAPSGELSRAECVEMTIKVNELRNRELGRVNSKEQRTSVDRCMQHGTRAQYECVQFANNAGELTRCDDLQK